MVFVVFVFIGIGVFLLPKCNNPKTEFRVATNIWPGYEILYLARTLGYYNNAPIRLLEVPSSSMVLRGLRNGTLEAGCVTLDEALTLLQDNIDIRVVLVIDESRGGDVLLAKPEIKTIQALRGKKIGLENSTVSAVLLDAALLQAGMKIEDVTLVPMAITEHYQAFFDGKVTAVATFEPVKSQLLEKNANILFSSAKIPGKILDIMVVRASAVEQYKEEILQLIQGYFKARNYFIQNASDASKIMEKRLGKDVLKQFEGLYLPDVQENKHYLQGQHPQIIQSAQNLISTMVKRNLLRRNFTVSNFSEPSFLPKE